MTGERPCLREEWMIVVEHVWQRMEILRRQGWSDLEGQLFDLGDCYRVEFYGSSPDGSDESGTIEFTVEHSEDEEE